MNDDELRSRLRALPVFDGELPAFDTDAAPERPLDLLCAWLLEAIDAGVRQPHAMTLSTVSADGRPTSRVLILKGVSGGRLQFASSRASRKGRELAVRPWAAINVYWPELGRQIRVRGRVHDAGPDAARHDYLARPLESRIESFGGRQSEPLADPADLERAVAEARARLLDDPDLVPGHWALYELDPDEAEFWQADPDRRHTRLSYRLENDRWVRSLLWP